MLSSSSTMSSSSHLSLPTILTEIIYNIIRPLSSPPQPLLLSPQDQAEYLLKSQPSSRSLVSPASKPPSPTPRLSSSPWSPPMLVKTSIISTVITTATNPQVCKAGRLGQVSSSQGGGQSCSWPWPLPAQWLWASAPPLHMTAPGSPGTRHTSPSGSTRHPPGVPAQTAESSTMTSFTPDRAAGQHVNQKQDGINQPDQLTGESSTDNWHLTRQWDSTSTRLTI